MDTLIYKIDIFEDYDEGDFDDEDDYDLLEEEL